MPDPTVELDFHQLTNKEWATKIGCAIKQAYAKKTRALNHGFGEAAAHYGGYADALTTLLNWAAPQDIQDDIENLSEGNKP